MTTKLDITGKLRFNREGEVLQLPAAAKFDHKMDHYIETSLIVQETETPLNLGDIQDPAKPAWLIVVNKDVNHSVQLLAATGETPFCIIEPSRFAGPFKLATTTPLAKAILIPDPPTGADPLPRIRYLLVEEKPDA